MKDSSLPGSRLARRRLLGQAGIAGLTLTASSVLTGTRARARTQRWRKLDSAIWSRPKRKTVTQM